MAASDQAGASAKASVILALDYGEARVGLALADSEVKFSQPLLALANDANLLTEIKKIASENKVASVVVGLPRNLAGDDTPQTASARKFANELEQKLALPVYLIDEAGTTLEAEARLKQSGRPYAKGEIDALAAALILDNYLNARETS